MYDFRDEFELDDEGRLHRKKRVLPDGATMHIPMGFYDGRFHPTFSDGSPDHTSPHKPGYRFADVNDQARIAADQAYEQRSRRMESAWKHKGEQQDAAHPPRTTTNTPAFDQSRANADAAYAERTKRMQNAWRHD